MNSRSYGRRHADGDRRPRHAPPPGGRPVRPPVRPGGSTAIGDLIDRFSRDLDAFTAAGRPFDVGWVRRYFTEDARVAYPPGSAVGAEAIAELIDGRGMAPFRRTHHVTTNYVVDLDGDRAGVRLNLIATHVLDDPPDAHFTVGDYYEGELARTDEGWRFTHQALHVTWTDGPPPGSGTGADRR